MNDTQRMNGVANLIKFSEECNAAIATGKPSRPAKRRLASYRRPLEAMKSDAQLGAIAYNRLAVLAAVLDYAQTGSELSRKKSINLHDAGDHLVASLAEQYKAVDG